ncbi:MAG: hypothetical protein CVV28_01740 [Methanobacteriales archaeon HGW-Methanobacteriales-1]|nr:MAG: hypothetical protein CVV28_01740 [Methanobacteriales archaeon HGW-Methanobacteriales-1]
MDSHHQLSKGFKVYGVIVIISLFSFIVLYSFFPDWTKMTNIDSASSVLSSLVQSEAAILGIVLTVSLVAVQLTASSFSTRVIQIFKNSFTLWILVSIYIFAIIYSIGVLKFISPINTVSNNEFYIWIAYLLGIYSFFALIPYMLDILDLMQPSKITLILSENITEKTLQNYLLKDKSDPIQPLMDILILSLLKKDFGTLREGLTHLKTNLLTIFNSNNIENEDLTNHIFDQLHILSSFKEITKDKKSASILVDILKECGSKSAEMKLEKSTLKSIHTLRIFGKVTLNENQEKLTLKVLESFEKIGVKCAENKLKRATPLSLQFLDEIGAITAQKRLNKALWQTIDCIEKIGYRSAEFKLKKTSRQSIYSLEKVAIAAAEQNLENRRRQAIQSIGRLGKKAAQQRLKFATLESIYSLRKIGELTSAPKKTLVLSISAILSVGKKATEQNIDKGSKISVTALVILGKKASEREMNELGLKTIYLIEQILDLEKENIELRDDIKMYLKELFLKNRHKLKNKPLKIESLIYD